MKQHESQELVPEAQIHARIADRAYEMYVQRGCEDGHSLEDWLEAENEVRETGKSSSLETDSSTDVPIEVAALKTKKSTRTE